MLSSPVWTHCSPFQCHYNASLMLSSVAAVLQWLRRRGPPVSEACRNRLLRDKKVRILEDGHLRQIRASAALQQGSQLLIPKTAVAQWQEPGTHRIKGDTPHYHCPTITTCVRTGTCCLLVCRESGLSGMPSTRASCHADARTEMLEDAVVQHLRGSIPCRMRGMLCVGMPGERLVRHGINACLMPCRCAHTDVGGCSRAAPEGQCPAQGPRHAHHQQAGRPARARRRRHTSLGGLGAPPAGSWRC